MPPRKKMTDNAHSEEDARQKRVSMPSVVIHVQAMDRDQEQRLSTAVDALLAEFVRQEMGRSKQS